MDNDELQSKLKLHAEWLDDWKTGRVCKQDERTFSICNNDLSNPDLDLRNMDLSYAYLANVNFRGRDLKNSKFYTADLRGANLNNAKLDNTNFKFANLENADLSMAIGVNTNFSSTCMNDVNAISISLLDASFTNADLISINFTDAKLPYADFTGVELWNADFNKADLRYTNLRCANINESLNFDKVKSIDFCAFPLQCGSLGVHMNDAMIYQLMYHLCSIKTHTPEIIKLQKLLIESANKFHRAEECGVLYIDETGDIIRNKVWE